MTEPPAQDQPTAARRRSPASLWPGVLMCVAVGVVLAQVMIDASGPRLSAQLAIVWLGLATLLAEAAARRKAESRRRYLLAAIPAMILWGVAVLLPPLRAFFIGGGLAWSLLGPQIFSPRQAMMYKEAVRYMRKEDYAAAIALMDRLIALEPHVPAHYDFRGQIHQLAGDMVCAEADFRKALDLDPDLLETRLALAGTAWLAGRLAEAREWAAGAIQRHPTDHGAFMAAGMIEVWDRQYAAALPLLEQAIQVGKQPRRDRALLHFWLAFLNLRAGSRDKALEHIAGLRRVRANMREWQDIALGNAFLPIGILITQAMMGTEIVLSTEEPLEALAQFETFSQPVAPEPKRKKRDRRR